MSSRPEPAVPLVVVSPHLDDGVFSCGQLLVANPGAVVVTVFAGRPDAYGGLSPWDVSCGFGAGDDVVGRRRDEDRAALSLLGARPVWLDFLDAQYGPPPAPEAIAEALELVITRLQPGRIFVPLGLFHSDHQLTSAAGLMAARRLPRQRWFVYADAIYRTIPILLRDRCDELRASGVSLLGLTGSPAGELKCRGVRAYMSQLRGLTTAGRQGYRDAFEPEEYWELVM